MQKTNNYKIPYQNDVILQKIHNCGNINNTIILHNSSCKISHIDSKTSIIIQESTNESKAETNQNMKYSVTSNNKRKCKRKLLPLHESSQLLSLSPVQNEEYSYPPFSIFKKKHKKNRNEIKKIVNKNNTECIDKKKKNYNGKTQKKTKKLVSKKIVIKKIVNEDILKKLKENKENVHKLETTHIYTLERNSSIDFQPTKTSSVVQFAKKKQMHKLNIVTTGLSNEDKDIVRNVVRALGSAKIELKVTKSTTHVVTTGVRTINLLHGIIRGCWLVNFEWILKSLENNAWLNPEKYEMAHFSKAVLENRKDRQLFGKSYVPELFTACGYIYVEKNTIPPYNVLKDLIKAAGGCITENPEIAKIIIGVEGLKETWILDCITSGELQPYNQYQRL
ncbi:rRNA methyltransferase 2, mitochondrial [Apis florea]|uniref:rRNA methyltransferase 2, mitochondrial n=1 Tax=Apis florea TaxID=7463 RepID=UPI0006290971|nr:rRNA methyltransferase 2, mitochondrial [Apis florea]